MPQLEQDLGTTLSAGVGPRPTGAAVALRRGLRRYWAPYLFISPFYILFVIFGLFPPLYGFYLSLQRWDGLTPPTFVGLRNYVLVLTDPLFWQAFGNTLAIAALSTGPGLILALVLAFLLNTSARRGQTPCIWPASSRQPWPPPRRWP